MSTLNINDKFHICSHPLTREKREYMVELYADNVLVVCDLVTQWNVEDKIELYKSNYQDYYKREMEKSNVS